MERALLPAPRLYCYREPFTEEIIARALHIHFLAILFNLHQTLVHTHKYDHLD